MIINTKEKNSLTTVILFYLSHELEKGINVLETPSSSKLPFRSIRVINSCLY